MNVEQDYFMVLGLKPGASPAEIKTAYRRLAKLYHPDHDQSLDAEVKYKEIRIAYEKLRDFHFADKTDKPPPGGYGSPERTTAASKGWEAERTTWTSTNRATKYDVDYGIKKEPCYPYSLIDYIKSPCGIRLILKLLLSFFIFMLFFSRLDNKLFYTYLMVWGLFTIISLILISFMERSGFIIDPNWVDWIFIISLAAFNIILGLRLASASAGSYALVILICLILMILGPYARRSY